MFPSLFLDIKAPGLQTPSTMWNHWVARTVHPEAPFQDFDTARWMWTRLAECFPEAVSAVLMPNHIHLIFETV
jgi:hypothetical protein